MFENSDSTSRIETLENLLCAITLRQCRTCKTNNADLLLELRPTLKRNAQRTPVCPSAIRIIKSDLSRVNVQSASQRTYLWRARDERTSSCRRKLFTDAEKPADLAQIDSSAFENPFGTNSGESHYFCWNGHNAFRFLQFACWQDSKPFFQTNINSHR